MVFHTVPPMASELDTAFLKEILKRGMVTDYQVAQARKTFQTMEKQGAAASVPQVFIQLRILKPDQVRSILSEIQSAASTAVATPPSIPAILPTAAVPLTSNVKPDSQHLEAPPLLEAPPEFDAMLEAPPEFDAPLEAPPPLEPPPLLAPLQVEEISVASLPPPPVTLGEPVKAAPSRPAPAQAQLAKPQVFEGGPARFSNKKIIAVKIAKAAAPVAIFVALSYGIYMVVGGLGSSAPPLAPQERNSQAGSSVPAETLPSPEPPERKDQSVPDLPPAELTYFEFENRFLTYLDKSDFMGALGYMNNVPSSVTKKTDPQKLEALRQRVINKAKERFKNKQAQISEYVAADDYEKALEIIKPLQSLDIPEINTLVATQIKELEIGMDRTLTLRRALAFQDIWMRIKPDLAQHDYNLVISVISNQVKLTKTEPIADLLTDSIDELKRGEEFMVFTVAKLSEVVGKSIRAFGRVVKVVSATRQTVNVKIGVKSGAMPLGKIEPESLVELFKDDELTDHQKYGLAIYAYAAGETKLGEEWLAKLPQDYEGPKVLRAFIGLTLDAEAVTYLNRLQMAVKQFDPSKIRLNGRKLLGEFKDTELVKGYEPWIKQKLQLKD